jgi:hypothetical protein
MLDVQLDHRVVPEWVKLYVGFYRTTIGSSADKSNSLVEESVVFRRFSTRFIFRSILEYLDNTRYSGTIDMLCMLVSRNEKDLENCQ